TPSTHPACSAATCRARYRLTPRSVPATPYPDPSMRKIRLLTLASLSAACLAGSLILAVSTTAGAQVDPAAPPAPIPAPTGIDLIGPELRAGATGREVALFQ